MREDYKGIIAVDGHIRRSGVRYGQQVTNLDTGLSIQNINYLAEINEAHFLEITMNNSTIVTMPIIAATMYQKYVIGDVEDDPVLELEPLKPERPDRSLINPPIWAWREVSSDWKAFSEVGGVLPYVVIPFFVPVA